MGEYMGSFKLGLSKLTMKLLLVTAATAAIALAAPYNPYSPCNLSPIPSYYYSPYNAISGGVPSAVYGTYSNLYSPYNTVSYSNQVPTATNAQLKISPSYNIPKSARAFVDNWPGLKTGNPCAVSGKAYMDAIIEGFHCCLWRSCQDRQID